MDVSNITIAVDGYSSCGKSTLAKDLASELQLNYIDTGAMYRAVTLFVIQNNWINEEGEINTEKLFKALPTIQLKFVWDKQLGRSTILLNNEDVEQEIRLPYVAKWVSNIAAIKEVRVRLVQMQREMGENGGVILDGRDIGSVVFPDADIKLFVTADPKIRAQRRLDELTLNGVNSTFDEVLDNLNQRDKMDINRAESPLIKVKDAIVLDTSFLTKKEQLDFVRKNIIEKF